MATQDECPLDQYNLIENLKAQLLLACTVLVALGFDISEALDIL